MGRSRLWSLGAILLVIFMVLGVSCAKKVVTMETAPAKEQAPQVSAQEQAAAQQAAADEAAKAKARAAEEERLRQEQMAKEAARMREEAAKKAEEAKRQAFQAEDIHFDFDKYVLKPEAMQILDNKATYLRDHSDVRVLIEGHCDERGSSAYNLALGERRANSAKSYLVRAGVAESRLVTISYGKEMPLCREHNENCWAKNRRAHFVIR
jgi:peptidoglycan-associated lipoprotein